VPAEILNWLDDEDDVVSDGLPGQHFRCDFGFMKGTGYCKRDKEGRTITSIDGHRTYFLIVDRKTRYIWVFLNKTKSPPIKIIAQFLREHGNPVAPRQTILSDKGSELWGCQAFQDAIQEAGYILEPTAPYAPFQNGMAERPNGSLGKMVRALLRNSALGPEYWPFALLHAVYLKNRLPHAATNQVPFTAYTG
jgi:transposase InsO family protein